MPLRDAQKPVSKQAERTSSTALSRQVPSPASPNLFEITSSMWRSAVRFGSRFAPPMAVVALFAAVLGFGGIAGAWAGIAQILFPVLCPGVLVARAVHSQPPV